MIYDKIFGWFCYASIFDKAIEKAANGDTFVEVGCYLGRSSAYMAEQIKESGKNIKYYAVDIWESTQDLGNVANRGEITDYNGKHIFDKFLSNLKPLKDYIKPLRIESVLAADYFEDGEIDFFFLDAQHDYDNVLADLKAWFFKVKPGGIMAGHDYLHEDWKGVRHAVDEFFEARGLIVKTEGISWVVQL